MLVITGTFDNGQFIPDEPVAIPQKRKVIITIEEYTMGDPKRKNDAFQNFKRYKGALPLDFDYKKELAEYRNERHGDIGLPNFA